MIKAYRFNKVAPWAIFVDRIPMFSFEEYDLTAGEDFLDEALTNMIECLGGGYYQLRVYKEVSPKGILNNTPYNYGFKFALLDDEEYETRGGRVVGSLEKRLAALENGGGEETEEEDKSFGATLGRVFNRPDVQEFVLQKIFGLVNTVFAQKNPMPAGMAGFTTMDTTQQQQQQPASSAELYNALPPDERQKFDIAAHMLMAGDPQVGTNLLKLANLLQNNPATYQALTKMAT